MTLIDLSNQLNSQGIYLVRVEHLTSNGLSFVGTLTEYLEVAKALGSKAVFVSTEGIAEEDFFYTNSHIPYAPSRTNTDPSATWPFPSPHRSSSERFQHYENYDEGDTETEEIDLCTLIPELKQFKKKIGEDGRFNLSIYSMGNPSLAFSIQEEWIEKFWNLHSKAEELIQERLDSIQIGREEKEAAERMKLQAKEDAKSQEMLQKLQALILDKEFVRLPTQRAMLEYAIDKIPELMDLAESDLKGKIQNLKAKIQAKGLGRK